MVIMDAFDEAMFSLALRDGFDDVRMVEGYNEFHPPENEHILDFICEAEDSLIINIFISHPPDASDTAELPPPWNRGKPCQWFRYFRSLWIYTGPGASRWAFKPPTLMEGALTTSWHKGDKAAEAVIRKVWRIVEGLTTNKVKVEFPRKGIVLSQGGKGGSDWFGHHALEWCRSDPEYMLNAQRRPADDWQMPETDWYQDLRRRVIDRFGADFGTPEPPEEPEDMPAPPGAFRLR